MSNPWTKEELLAASKAMEGMGSLSYEDFCRELAEQFGQVQSDHRYPCPRCGKDTMDEKPTRNALSRKGNIHICDQCGSDEAMQAYSGTDMPFSEWAITTTPTKFQLRSPTVLELTFVGCDGWGRPVYKDANGRLFKDVDPRPNRPHDLCTTSSFEGEPDTPISAIAKYAEMTVSFLPERVTW